MARDSFYDVATQAGAGGALIALENVQVSVYRLNTDGSRVPVAQTSIYQARTGAGVKTNPFYTTTTGEVYFFADAGEYEVEMIDQVVPKRTGDKTIGWNSSPMTVGGVPANTIAGDGGLPYGSLSNQAKLQDVPVGGVIDWWRPTSNVPVPEGYVVCDGQTTLTVSQHDFGTGASVIVPDFRNAFILGASIQKTDGQAGGGTDAATDGPGIRGTGGSQFHALSAAQTPLRTHTHSGTTGTENQSLSHTHSAVYTGGQNGDYFAHWSPGDVRTADRGSPGAGAIELPTYRTNPTTAAGGPAAHNHNFTTGNPSVAEATGSNHNNMPRYVGLLKIMKVKR